MGTPWVGPAKRRIPVDNGDLLQGAFEVTASDGDVRRLTPGSVLILEDTTGKGHSTAVIGDDDGLVFGVALA